MGKKEIEALSKGLRAYASAIKVFLPTGKTAPVRR